MRDSRFARRSVSKGMLILSLGILLAILLSACNGNPQLQQHENQNKVELHEQFHKRLLKNKYAELNRHNSRSPSSLSEWGKFERRGFTIASREKAVKRAAAAQSPGWNRSLARQQQELAEVIAEVRRAAQQDGKSVAVRLRGKVFR